MIKTKQIKPLILALSLGLVACSAALTQAYAGTADTSGMEFASSVAYANGRYVAVGPRCNTDMQGPAQTYVSTGGTSWQTYTPFAGSGDNHYCMDSVTYANNRYIAAGMQYTMSSSQYHYTALVVFTSFDGKKWLISKPKGADAQFPIIKYATIPSPI